MSKKGIIIGVIIVIILLIIGYFILQNKAVKTPSPIPPANNPSQISSPTPTQTTGGDPTLNTLTDDSVTNETDDSIVLSQESVISSS